MKLATNQKTGLLYLLASLVMLPFWYITLFMYNPPSLTPLDHILYFLIESPHRLFYWWLLVLPILCWVLSVAYFSSFAQIRMGAFSLFWAGVLLALAVLFTATTFIVFVSLPLLFAFANFRQHLTHHSSGTR